MMGLWRHDQDAAVAAATVADDARSALLADLLGRVAGCFPRRETRQCCGQMVSGLLMELEDHNCWTIAEAAGHRGPHRLQHLLSRAVWDEQQVLDIASAWAVSHLDDGDAVLIVDETADEKILWHRGRRGPPVQRHRRRYRAVPGGGHLDLCHRPRACADRPGFVPARSVRR